MGEHITIGEAYVEIRKGWEDPDDCQCRGGIPGDGPGSIEIVPYRAMTCVAMYERAVVTIWTEQRSYTIKAADDRAALYWLGKITHGISRGCGVPSWRTPNLP